MPVHLDAIPDNAAGIRRPVTSRWLMAGVLILIISAGVSLWFWTGTRAGAKFWFTATCLPVLLWGSLFALRRISYKLDCVSCASWNKERQALIASETAIGQRFAWLVAEYLINGFETDDFDGVKTQQIAVNNAAILEHVTARDGISSVRHSALPRQGKSAVIFTEYLHIICNKASDMLGLLPENMPCYIAFDGSETISELADNLVCGINFPVRRTGNLTELTILDDWLDRHYEHPAALLIISAQIYDMPPQDSGEAITMMLLSNRRHANVPVPGVRIHRPQITMQNSLSHALSRAMLWGKLSSTDSLRGWITGGKLASDESWSIACAACAPKLTAQRNVNLDIITGYAGKAAVWQALILAARQCQTDQEAQIVVVECAPLCHQLCAVTPEITSGNV